MRSPFILKFSIPQEKLGESSTVKLLGWTEITKPMGYATELLLGDRVKRSHAKESKEKSLGLRARASGGRIRGIASFRLRSSRHGMFWDLFRVTFQCLS